MTVGLPISRLINLQISLTPNGVQYANINTLLILGDSAVITVGTYNSYGSLEEVLADFDDTDPEYLAAVEFFGQSPQPTQLYIGRYNQGVTTALATVEAYDILPFFFYGVMFAAATMPSIADNTAIAAYLEAAATPHLFGVTTADTNAINAGSQADIGAIITAAGYKRTFCDYSTTNPYSVASVFGRLVTVNLDAEDSMITLMYKQMPGITPEVLTSTHANTLDTKRYNYYATFSNTASIYVNGWCGGDAFIDEMFGADALGIRLQTDVFNLLATTNKVPQTDGGNNRLYTIMEEGLEAFVNNGFLAPGTWESSGFGQLQLGDFLPKGFYIYAPPIASQSQTDRAARKSVVFQIAAKEAGAVHTADIQISVNR